MTKSFAAGLTIGLILSLVIIAIYPSSSDYNLQNPYWNGMSDLRQFIHPVQINNIANLTSVYAAQSASNFALLVLGPTLPYSQVEIASISNFVSKGGLLVIADDFGAGNQLLQGLGINVRFSGVLLLDPLYNVKAQQLPLITDVNVTGIKNIAFNYATYLNLTSPQRYPVTFIAYSSPFSFGDMKQTASYLQGDPLGPLPVVASVSYGSGSVIIISDSSLFLNSMISYADNYQFLKDVVANRQAVIDTSHWLYSYQSEASMILLSSYYFIQNSGLKYGIAALLMLLIYIFNFRFTSKSEDRDIHKLLMNHPDWDKNELKKLYEQRKSVYSKKNNTS
jgi:hypothetical protein